MLTLVEFIGGFVLLLFGAEYLLRGAVSIARRFHISPLVIGLTIVAFGTSAPELMVSFQAALNGAPEIAIGNVVGSNISNILLVMGASALIFPIVVKPRDLYRDAAVMLGSATFFAAVALGGAIARWQGVLMLLTLPSFAVYAFIAERRRGTKEGPGELAAEFRSVPDPIWLAGLSVFGGLAALIYGGDLLVAASLSTADALGIGAEVIGLTVVSVGTSLPELATASVAAYRRNTDVVVGNIVGTNIFNLLAIVGIISAVSPISVPGQIVAFDIWVMLCVTIVMLGSLLFYGGLTRRVGGAFLAAFVVYVSAEYYGIENIIAL
jgi:cation:H+ antiporter